MNIIEEPTAETSHILVELSDLANHVRLRYASMKRRLTKNGVGEHSQSCAVNNHPSEMIGICLWVYASPPPFGGYENERKPQAVQMRTFINRTGLDHNCTSQVRNRKAKDNVHLFKNYLGMLI